jgi:hypothetical protein
MSGAGYVIAWILCVIVGAAAGVLLGWLLWELGLELIGSAVFLVGGILGGILAFMGFLRWTEGRNN